MKALRGLRQTLRFVTVLGLIGLYSLTSFVVAVLVIDRWRVRQIRAWLISRNSRAGLWVMGVRVNEHGVSNLRRNHLIVSNHLSYLDILVIASRVPTSFVTSIEIRETPFLGVLSELGGCLYVERRNRQRLANEIRELTEGLERGLSITIFPEATSTNGEQVLRFRKPLYNAAILSRTPVLSVCLNYKTISGSPLNLKNRDVVFWYGDMPFVSHLWAMVGQSHIEVELSALACSFADDRVNDLDLASHTHALVAQTYRACVV